MQRVQKRGELIATECRAVDQIERIRLDGVVRVGDTGQCVAAERDAGRTLVCGSTTPGIGHPVAVGIDRHECVRIGAGHELLEELLVTLAEVVGKADVLNAGAIHKDDFCLDRDLRRADVELLHACHDLRETRRHLGDDQLIGRAVGSH